MKCEEKGKKYILENTRGNLILVYKMDGGIITDEQSIIRCDYLYAVNDEDRYAVLTELKGTDSKKALCQIKETLSLFPEFFSSFSHIYGRAVVTSCIPKIKAEPNYVNLEKLLRLTYKGNLKIYEKQFIEKDIKLNV